ncbi:MAG TPA: DUF4388 domain-containing protein [Crinalium sp.]|jgi:hypothetical protein
MAITGYLAEFSLAEIFQVLEQGRKTGLLSICGLTKTQPDSHDNHYVWFTQGRIVAAAQSLDHQGLTTLMSQRGWLGDRAAFRLAQVCASDTPMGLCLKSQGVLQAEQLKLLFYSQVMRQVCALFEMKDGWFQFDAKAPIPVAELTGLSAPATDVTLAGLRALKDWSALQDKLPEPTSALISVIEGKPNLRLNQVEWQIWEFTNGTMSLKAIADQLNLPIEKAQQVAFRLILVGLAEELPAAAPPMPVAHTPSMPEESLHLEVDAFEPHAEQQAKPTKVSHSFLENLVGFLKGKV